MAGSQKQFELLFKLQASLGSGFNSTFKKAISVNNQLRDSLKNVNSTQSKIDGYQKQVTAIEKNQQKLDSLNTSHEKIASTIKRHKENIAELEKKIAETGDSTGALTAQLKSEENALKQNEDKLERNERQIQQTTAAGKKHEEQLKKCSEELKEAGINTDNLEEANGRLEKSYEKLKKQQQTLQQLNEKQKQVQASITATKTQLAGTITKIGAAGAALYAGPVQAAMSFESNMAEVAKVVSWLKDDTGAITKEYKELQNEILSLSSKIPMTAEEISQIMAAAGQSNVAQNNAELVKFTEDAAKMGIAFDISAEQAGEWMAKWRTSFHMSQEQVIALSDQINYLGNTSAANASQISEIVTKIGPLGEVAGLCSGEIAALGASLVAVGVNEDVAATGIKKVMTTMTAGAAATKRQKDVLNQLGMSATELAERMQNDAQGAIIDFLETVQRLPEAEQAAALKNYFGEEAVAAIAPLLTNLSYLEEQFQKVGDASLYAGSMQGEYAARADTTENKVQLAKNSIQSLIVTLGNTFLPVVGEVAEKVQVVITKITEFAQANPELVKTITKVAAALAAVKVGMLAGKLVTLSMEDGILSLITKLVGLRASFTANAATSVSFATKLKATGKGILNYFGNVKEALVGVKTAIVGIFSGKLTGNKFVKEIAKKLLETKGLFKDSLSAIKGTILEMLLDAGSGIQERFTLIGAGISKKLAGWGTIFKNSAIGKFGTMIATQISGVFKKFGTLLAPVGNAIKTILGPIGNLMKTALGPLGGIAAKVLPVVGVVTAVITVFKLLRDNIDKIRDFIQRTFGDEALATFNKIVSVITTVGETIKNVFSDGNIGIAREKIQELFGEKGAAVFDIFVNGLKTIIAVVEQVVGFITEHMVPVAEDILKVIATQVIPGVMNAIQTAAPIITGIIQSVADFIGAIIPIIGGFIAQLTPIIREVISFISTHVLPIISEVFNFVCSTVLPAISSAVQAILPVITNVLSILLPAIQTALTTIWNIISPIIQGVLSMVQAVMPVILDIVQSVVETISGVISDLTTVLSGLIEFITGVFSGNWSQAWEGIQIVFSGIWESIKTICKGAINTIISAVNVVIRGLSNFKVPDWVPGIGGKGINIAEIPMFAKGTKNTPNTFIAGEKGPELITNAPGRTVFTADQTKKIMESRNTAARAAMQMQTTAPAQTVNNYQAAPEVINNAGNGNGSSKNITINNNPTIMVNGEKPEDLDAKLQENNERLLRQVEDLMEEKEDKERRQKYD